MCLYCFLALFYALFSFRLPLYSCSVPLSSCFRRSCDTTSGHELCAKPLSATPSFSFKLVCNIYAIVHKHIIHGNIAYVFLSHRITSLNTHRLAKETVNLKRFGRITVASQPGQGGLRIRFLLQLQPSKRDSNRSIQPSKHRSKALTASSSLPSSINIISLPAARLTQMSQ